MKRLKTHIVGIISIDALQDEASAPRGGAAPRFSLPQPDLWPNLPESIISADNEQLQFELESAYLEFMNQMF